ILTRKTTSFTGNCLLLPGNTALRKATSLALIPRNSSVRPFLPTLRPKGQFGSPPRREDRGSLNLLHQATHSRLRTVFSGWWNAVRPENNTNFRSSSRETAGGECGSYTSALDSVAPASSRRWLAGGAGITYGVHAIPKMNFIHITSCLRLKA